MKFPVSEAKNKELQSAMAALNISESDIKEKFILSSGAGGQKVNKTHSGVVLTYHSYCIKWDRTREQMLNRYYARKALVEKISENCNKVTKKQLQIAKKKKNKRRRQKRSKAKYH